MSSWTASQTRCLKTAISKPSKQRQQHQQKGIGCLHISVILLSGHPASSFRLIGVCTDRTCAWLCVYVCLFWGGWHKDGRREDICFSFKMLKPWDINAFARQHDGLMVHAFCVFVEIIMSRILCNFVFASKDEPCNPRTQNVFLTHGTMLPVWSSDRAHAGRCLAKADCRFTSSKTAMRLKKQVARATWKRDTFAFVDGFFGCRYFPRFNLDMGEQSSSQLKTFLMQWRPRLWHRAVFSIWTVGVGPRMVFAGLLGQKKITPFALWFNKLIHRLRVVLSPDSRANLRQKSLKQVFVTTAVCFIMQRGFRLRQGSAWLR